MEYTPIVDVMIIVSVEDVMKELDVGPYGALMYCMEYLVKLNKLEQKYIIFNEPGQVELYTHHVSNRNIFNKLEELGFHLCFVHLVDSHYCSDASKFISTLLLPLSTMLQITLPQSLLELTNVVDKVNEYVYGIGEERTIQYLLACAEYDMDVI